MLSELGRAVDQSLRQCGSTLRVEFHDAESRATLRRHSKESRMSLRMSFWLTLLVLSMNSTADARVIYVNNLTGSDRFDGVTQQPTSDQSGPVRTIRQALRMSHRADTIELARTDSPYFESFSIVGERLSGVSGQPFRIVGNGAVISGARAVPDGGWQKVGDDLWSLNPSRKGQFLLLCPSRKLVELLPEPGQTWTKLPELAVDQWCGYRGRIYYRSEPLDEPQSKPFGVAGHDCGITVYGVSHVLISDVTVQHFRLDGVGVPDLARNIELRNVRMTENGRAGLSVGGSAFVTLKAGTIEKNGRNSVLITEAASVDVKNSTLDQEPTLK